MDFDNGVEDAEIVSVQPHAAASASDPVKPAPATEAKGDAGAMAPEAGETRVADDARSGQQDAPEAGPAPQVSPADQAEPVSPAESQPFAPAPVDGPNPHLDRVLEAVLLAAGRPLSLDSLQQVFEEGEQPDKAELREALHRLQAFYQDRGIELAEVASGWRIQVRSRYGPWVNRLWEEKAPRFSRAMLETLALVAYRQPITRGEIEEVRGVTVSTNIIKTLLEREWVKVVGHRDVPGKPALYGTTRDFLDDFGLRSLEELPTLSEIRDLEDVERELDLPDPEAEVETELPASVEASVSEGEAPLDAESAGEAVETPASEPTATEPKEP